MFYSISKDRKSGFENQLWKSDEILFRVYNVSVLKSLIILEEIQSNSSRNFVIIKILFANLLHGRDFLCFFLMHC